MMMMRPGGHDGDYDNDCDDEKPDDKDMIMLVMNDYMVLIALTDA